jgi:hypothetical protein
MIKLGIFGDHTSNPDLVRRIDQIPGVAIEGIYFSGNASVPEGFKEFYSPVELMRLSDAVLVISERSISNDLIKLILRKSKHIYLRAIPQLTLREIKELTDLEKEAGIVNYIYNPFDFIPYFDALKKKDNPVLINLRTCFEGKMLSPGNEMLLLVTALHRMVQNNYKKTEVFGIKDVKGQLVINTRIEYEDSSVVDLTVTNEQSAGHCEIFRYSGKAKFEFSEPLYNAFPDADKEYTSICNFIHVIQQGVKPANSFDNLQNGVRIVNEINEHLRFNDIRV